MKNKKYLYIILLQIAFILATVALIFIVKHFFKDTYRQVEEGYHKHYDEETVIETGNAAIPVMTSLSNDGNTFCIPVKGTVTSEFGERNDPFTNKKSTHKGIDIAACKGTEILSASSGEVIKVGYDENGYGNYLRISHNGAYQTLYGHCSEILVNEGDKVAKGQPVAKVGSTGRSTGNHLHFEVLINGKPYNARWFMEF